MTIQLYGHPFAAFVWKPLIAAYERNVPFTCRMVDQDHAENLHRMTQLSPTGQQDPRRVAETKAALDKSYAWLSEHIGTGWANGDSFSIADCAAAPALFYADWVHLIPDGPLKTYRSRLLQSPSVARVVDEARPYRSFFPLGAPDRD